MTLGQFIQKIRLEKGYSQRKLAILSNVSNTTISRIESDAVAPDIDTLDKIAIALKLDIKILINYLNNNSNNEFDNEFDNDELTDKEKKDIANELEKIKKELLESEELMFDGLPMSDDSIENILSALEIGMEQVRRKNKAKYTPKKYKANN